MKTYNQTRLLFIKTGFLTISALLYCVALYAPNTLWWCMFLFPIPLYLLSCLQKLTFMHGFHWGVLFFSITLYPFFNSILSSKIGSSCITVLFITTLSVFYCAFYSACWFWLMGICTRALRSPKYTNYARQYTPLLIPIWLATTLLYIITVDHYCLWPFLRLEGIPLLHPLIPLTAQSPLLWALPFLGKNILTLLLLLPAATGAYVCVTYTSRYQTTNNLLVLCSLTPWIIFLIAPIGKSSQTPAWTAYIAWLPLQVTGHRTAALLLHHTFKKIIKEKPNTQLIILPESALYTDALCSNAACTQLWQSERDDQPLFIIAGSFNRTENSFFNTCYLIDSGIMAQQFNKKHTMPFIEHLPLWVYYRKTISLFFTNLFFTDLPPITPASNTREPFTLYFNNKTNNKNTDNSSTEIVQLMPYICSELFFNEHQDNVATDMPLLALINDTWATHTYIHILMVHAAQLKALQWHCEILYISYNHAFYITKTGELLRF